MYLNNIFLAGTLASAPKAQRDTQTPCVTTRLCVTEERDGQLYNLYVPLEAWGKAAQSLGELVEGTMVLVKGKLKWKSWEKNGQKQGSLVVRAWQVQALTPVAAMTDGGRH